MSGTGSPTARIRTRGAKWAAALGIAALATTGVFWFARTPAPTPPDLAGLDLDPDVVAAVDEARRRVEAEPDSPAAWGRLGMLFFAHDFYAEGLACLEQAERLDPADFRWPYYQAMALLQDHPAAGVPCLRRSAQNGGGVSANLRLGEALLALHRDQEAASAFQAVLAADPDHARAHLGLGLVAVRNQDWQPSLAHLQRAAANPLTQRAASVSLAEVFLQLHEPEQAAAARQRSVGMPDDRAWPDPLLADIVALQKGVPLHVQRADYLMRQGRVPEAANVLSRLLADQPQADEGHLKLAQGLMRQARWDDAEQALREAIRLRPETPEAHFLLGTVHWTRGESDAAETALRKAIDVRPNHALAHFYLGLCRKRRQDSVGALESWQTALRYRPNLAEAHVASAELLLEQGQREQARSHLQDALRLKPNHASAQKLLDALSAR